MFWLSDWCVQSDISLVQLARAEAKLQLKLPAEVKRTAFLQRSYSRDVETRSCLLDLACYLVFFGWQLYTFVVTLYFRSRASKSGCLACWFSSHPGKAMSSDDFPTPGWEAPRWPKAFHFWRSWSRIKGNLKHPKPIPRKKDTVIAMTQLENRFDAQMLNSFHFAAWYCLLKMIGLQKTKILYNYNHIIVWLQLLNQT